jgi:hypothetical protein
MDIYTLETSSRRIGISVREAEGGVVGFRNGNGSQVD